SPLCLNSDLRPTGVDPQVLSVDDTNPPTSWSTGIVPLNPPFNYAGIITEINLGDGTNAGGFDAVSSQTFGTPEPGSVFLLAGGLVAIALRRRIPGLYTY
ncbi:MAG: PEP-CTERM sorting domain-containing protein, partial [Acidobacteriota bacterium]|nr:PEP-CTERM sorting domain-containing protein [Acidobacteriota bacterium]